MHRRLFSFHFFELMLILVCVNNWAARCTSSLSTLSLSLCVSHTQRLLKGNSWHLALWTDTKSFDFIVLLTSAPVCGDRCFTGWIGKASRLKQNIPHALNVWKRIFWEPWEELGGMFWSFAVFSCHRWVLSERLNAGPRHCLRRPTILTVNRSLFQPLTPPRTSDQAAFESL